MAARAARDQREQTEDGSGNFAKYDTVSNLATLMSRRHSSGASVGLWWRSRGFGDKKGTRDREGIGAELQYR
jgi:hypothetical protein